MTTGVLIALLFSLIPAPALALSNTPCTDGQWEVTFVGTWVDDWSKYYARTYCEEPAAASWFGSIGWNWGLGGVWGLWPDDFQAHFKGNVQLSAGLVEFSLTSDDGAILWLDGKQIINDWSQHEERTRTAQVWVTGGSHEVKMDYFEAKGLAVAELKWNFVKQNTWPRLYPYDGIVSYLEGQALNFKAYDPDEGQTLTYEFTGGTLPPGLSFDANSGITGSLDTHIVGPNQSKRYVFGLRVRDNLGADDEKSWNVEVKDVPITLGSVPTQSSRTGDTVSLQIPVNNPDGDPVYWVISGLPPGLSIDGSGKVKGTIDLWHPGTYTVDVAASEVNQNIWGSNARTRFTWNVAPKDASYIDTTPPSLSYTPNPAPSAAGWWKVRPSIQPHCQDSQSGVESCTSTLLAPIFQKPEYKEGTGNTVRIKGVDRAGNVATQDVTVPIDWTVPSVSGSSVAPPNQWGWYNGDVTVTWQASDALSGIDPTSLTTTETREGRNLVVTGSVRDKAGNVANPARSGINIDRTPPVTTSAVPDGWTNQTTVTLTATDTISGVRSTTYQVGNGASVEGSTLSFETDGEHTFTYWSQDQAGNTEAPRTGAIRIDRTPPTITATASTPASSTWHTADVTVSFTCADDVSGVAACPEPLILSEEGPEVSATGTAVDRAGNIATVMLPGLKIDKTAPVTTASVQNGWYGAPVTLAFSAVDTTSGVKATFFRINGGAVQSGSAVTLEADGMRTVEYWSEDQAGLVESLHTAAIGVDRTLPEITATLSPAANAAGWNNTDVSVAFACSDSHSGIAACAGPITLTQEGREIAVTGQATDKVGHQAKVDLSVSIDKTAPVITATADRAPNQNGWYSAPVTVTFACADSLSGVESCSGAQTVATEGSALAVSGTAADRVGNSAGASLSVNVDLNGPVIEFGGNLGTYTADQEISITCAVSDSVSGVASASCPVVSGPAYTFAPGTYTLQASAVDQAGNQSTQSLTFTVATTQHSLINLTNRFVTDPAVADRLTAMLDAIKSNGNKVTGPVNGYIQQVRAQIGKSLNAEQAEILIRLVESLQ